MNYPSYQTELVVGLFYALWAVFCARLWVFMRFSVMSYFHASYMRGGLDLDTAGISQDGKTTGIWNL